MARLRRLKCGCPRMHVAKVDTQAQPSAADSKRRLQERRGEARARESEKREDRRVSCLGARRDVRRVRDDRRHHRLHRGGEIRLRVELPVEHRAVHHRELAQAGHTGVSLTVGRKRRHPVVADATCRKRETRQYTSSTWVVTAPATSTRSAVATLADPHDFRRHRSGCRPVHSDQLDLGRCSTKKQRKSRKK